MSVLPLLKFEIREVSSHPPVLISDQAIAYKRHPKQRNLLTVRGATLDAKGYYVLGYRGVVKKFVTCFIHRLVAEAFLPSPQPKEEVRHLDGKSTNNLPRNLAWGTRKQNMADAMRHGTFVNGDRHYCARIADQDAADIRWLSAMGASDAAISHAYDVPRQLVSRIRRRRTWKHV